MASRATTRAPPPMPAPIPAFAPTERPESDAVDVVFSVSVTVGLALALALDVLIVAAPVRAAGGLVDADGLAPEFMRIIWEGCGPKVVSCVMVEGVSASFRQQRVLSGLPYYSR